MISYLAGRFAPTDEIPLNLLKRNEKYFFPSNDKSLALVLRPRLRSDAFLSSGELLKREWTPINVKSSTATTATINAPIQEMMVRVDPSLRNLLSKVAANDRELQTLFQLKDIEWILQQAVSVVKNTSSHQQSKRREKKREKKQSDQDLLDLLPAAPSRDWSSVSPSKRALSPKKIVRMPSRISEGSRCSTPTDMMQDISEEGERNPSPFLRPANTPGSRQPTFSKMVPKLPRLALPSSLGGVGDEPKKRYLLPLGRSPTAHDNSERSPSPARVSRVQVPVPMTSPLVPIRRWVAIHRVRLEKMVDDEKQSTAILEGDQLPFTTATLFIHRRPGSPSTHVYQEGAEIGRGTIKASVKVFQDVDTLQTLAVAEIPVTRDWVRDVTKNELALYRLFENEDHIVKVHSTMDTTIENGESVEVMRIAFEHYKHGDLRSLLERNARLPIVIRLELARGIARGLKAIHDRNIVHRDLKPGNILIGESSEGHLKAFIGDLGLSCKAGSPRVQWAAGTPCWMAPEVERRLNQTLQGVERNNEVISTESIDGKSADIYSLGLVLSDLLGTPSSGGWKRLIGEMLDPMQELRPTINKVVEKLEAIHWNHTGSYPLAATLDPIAVE